MSIAQIAFRVVPLLAAVLLSAGSSTYSTRRAALVPEIAPPMRSGAAMETLGEVALSVPGAASLGDDEISAGAEPGLELPRWQLGGAGRLRVSKHLDLGLVFEQARAEGARPLAADQPEVDGGDAFGVGVSSMTSFELGEGFRLAFTGELLSYSIPYVEYRTCVDCSVPYTEVTRGRTRLPVIGVGIVPSWRQGRWTFFGGVSGRNQPTVERGGLESELDHDSDVLAGSINLMVHAGAEVALGANVKALAMVYKSVDGTPVDYAPTFALGLSWGFGEVKKPAPTPALPPGYEPAPAAAPAAVPTTTERGAPSAAM